MAGGGHPESYEPRTYAKAVLEAKRRLFATGCGLPEPVRQSVFGDEKQPVQSLSPLLRLSIPFRPTGVAKFTDELSPVLHDAADRESSRPDFAIALYPGHLALAKDNIALNPDIAGRITRETPPTFLLQNEDDHVDEIEDSLSYYMGLKKAGVPVELHAYAQGGHAFGLRETKRPVSGWPQLVERWLRTIGVLSE
jgi:acetyl esterase/lipase